MAARQTRLLLAAQLPLLAAALRIPTPVEHSCSRRVALARGVFRAAGASAALMPVAASAIKVYADGNDERCENGEGAACARLAGDNELVKRLQEQSKRNKAKNEQ
eukprot:4358082-Prymnesium_polylepis.1